MGCSDRMDPGTRLKKKCEERLRALVPSYEAIGAVGLAVELSTLRPDIGSGAGSTFIVVTSHRLLFAEIGSLPETHYAIRLGDVTQWASGVQYNRLVMVLTHPAMPRRLRVPAKKILWFEWGNAEAEVSSTQTIFRFSRPDTQVATALRSALAARGVPHQPLRFEEKSRKERMGASHPRLYAKRR